MNLTSSFLSFKKCSGLFLLLRCILLCSCLLTATTANAGKPDSTSAVTPLIKPKVFLSTLGNDFVEQAKAPFHIRGKQFLYLGAGILTTAFLIKEDEFIDSRIRHLKSDHEWINKSSPQITELGSNYGIIGVALFEAYGLTFKNTKAQETGLLAAQAMITSGVWARVGKLLSGRERPSAAYSMSHEPGGKWYGPVAQFQGACRNYPVTAFDGFPSGHMATAFSIATVFAEQYSDCKAVPPIAYTIASLVGFTRLTEHTHWASDVFAGSALGYLCGKQVVHNYRKRKEAAAAQQSSIEISGASVSSQHVDVSLLMTF